MAERSAAAGNGGSGRGLVDVVQIAEGCHLFKANPQQPPPAEEMPLALCEVLQKWMAGNPVRIRTTLPLVQNGNTIGVFVWSDRPSP